VSDGLLVAAGTALWIGLLTAVSPCPLATNVAAVAYLARHAHDRRRALLAGGLFALGRAAVYVVLAALLVASLLSSSAVSDVLQRHGHLLVGPLLVVIGMVLLDLLRLPVRGGGALARAGERLRDRGPWGAFALGAVLALAFCPVSAALYFGALVPLAVRASSPVLLPALFGVATAAPVVAFAWVLTAGVRRVGASFRRVRGFERFLRPATGAVFVAIGVFLTVSRVYLGG